MYSYTAVEILLGCPHLDRNSEALPLGEKIQ